MSYVSTILASTNAIKGAFLVLVSLALTSYRWPVSRTVKPNSTFTHIIVGAGCGGSVVANRLTEDPTVTVLLIEAGGDPTIDSMIPATFFYSTQSKMDWNFTSKNDGHTAQYTANKNFYLPSGLALGGSSSIHHYYDVRGYFLDYDSWATVTGDNSWSYENILQYFIRSERVEDEYIKNSKTSHYHGTIGNMGITREKSDSIQKYLKAFEEVGHNITEELNTGYSIGFSRAFYFILNGIRQSCAECYLSPTRNRPNLYMVKDALVTKIIFENNKIATGVQYTTSDGSVITVNAEKDIVVSAGAFNTPKLLMLSGVGPSDHLTSLNISVVSDLPVGKTLEDHLDVVLFHQLENSTKASAVDPGLFPIPSFVGLTPVNSTQFKTECSSVNVIVRDEPSTLVQLSTFVFGLHDDVSNRMYELGKGKEILVTALNVARPYSTGSVQLRSTDPADSPLINTGFLSNTTDLDRTVACIQDFIKVTQSTYFQSVGGQTVYFRFPNCTDASTADEYWRCYVLHMMNTNFDYSGTSPMGTVLDNNLCVKGVGNLRVVDASAMPNVVSGKINAAVLALAEKGSDLIKKTSCVA